MNGAPGIRTDFELSIAPISSTMTEPMDDTIAKMVQPVQVTRWNCVESKTADDHIVIEQPLEICLNDQLLAVTMRTPGADRDLAVGFAVSEGIIRSPEDLFDVTLCGGDPGMQDVVRATLFVPEERVPKNLQNRSQQYAVSACGLCGRTDIDHILGNLPVLTLAQTVHRSVIFALPNRLREVQIAFKHTGGLHGVAIFDDAGQYRFHGEDVGRHNAVDKVIGMALQSGLWPPKRHILMVSGRIGFEIVQKAAMAQIPVVCAVSAPSSLAVEVAKRCGITLIGFLREDKMNVYSFPERILNL